MAGSEDVSEMQDDDLDLYDDFIVSNIDQKYVAKVNLKQHNEDVERENESLKLRISNLEQEFEASKKINLALRRNISVLYKTAKQEIEAKNSLIRDLQTRYDSLVFRRSKRDAVSSHGGANSSFANSAELPPCLPVVTSEENSESNKHALPCNERYAQSYSKSHNRRTSINQTGAAEDANRGRNMQISTPAVDISNKTSVDDVSSILNVHTKDSRLGDMKDLPKNDEAKDKPDVKLNGSVLNSISIDSLKEITKLCNDSSPQNSKKSLRPRRVGITDAERVLAHYKHKAKLSVTQICKKRTLKHGISNCSSRSYKDNIICQEQGNNHESKKLSKHRHPSKNIEAANNNQQNGGRYLCKDTPILHGSVKEMEMCVKTNGSLRIVEKISGEVRMPKSCQIEEQEKDAINLSDTRQDCQEMDTLSKNEKISDAKLCGKSSDLRKRPGTKKDGCSPDLKNRITERSRNERCHTNSPSCTRSHRITDDRSIAKYKEKSPRKSRSENNNKTDRKNNHSRSRPNKGDTSSHIPSLNKHTSHLIKSTERSKRRDRTSISLHRKSHTEKHKHSKPEVEKLHLDDRDSRGNHEQSNSLMMQNRSTKCNGSKKNQRLSLDSTKYHSPISHLCKSDTVPCTAPRVHKDKCKTQASRHRESSKRQKPIDFDASPKHESHLKKARLTPDRFTKRSTLPMEDEPFFKPDDLEEGELSAE